MSNGDVYERECVEVSDDGNEPNQILTYNRRFYILFVFSLTAFAQYCAWNAFGPISGTVKAVFGWGNAEIALLASLDPITYILTMVFFSWLMDVKGLSPAWLIYSLKDERRREMLCSLFSLKCA